MRKPMQVMPIQASIIQPGQDLLLIIISALSESLQERDILCVTSKVVAISQGRLVRFSKRTAINATVATKQEEDDFVAVVRQEADVLFNEQGPVYLTLKDGIFIANAGVDLSNTPPGTGVLWPQQPWAWAADLCIRLGAHYAVEELAVVVTDSHVTPLRKGVTGLALAYAGLEGVESDVGRPDLFGRPMAVTTRAVADGLASAAVLLMGEADERTPFALIRNAPVHFTSSIADPRETQIDPRQDLFSAIYHDRVWAALARLDGAPGDVGQG